MKQNGKLNINLFALIAAAAFIVAVLFACFSVYQTGMNVGAAMGTAVGSAVGSKNGLNTGIADGRKAGLSAVETTAVLEEKMEAAGRLQVLAAGVTLNNAQKVGTAYNAIEILKGDLVFTVDLQNATVSVNDTQAVILIETPQVQFYLDELESEKIMEVSKFSLITNAEDGVTAFLNSRIATVKSVEENIQGYKTLMDSAKEAAIAQTKSLAEAACGGSKTVVVGFKGE